MRHIPALRLSPRLPHAQSLTIVRMHLDRKFFMGEQKFQQQRKALWVSRSFSHQLALMLLAQLRQRLPHKRPVRYLAVVSAQPGLADLFRKFMVRINWRQIQRSPWSGIKTGKHQQWIQVSHSHLAPTKKTARERNGLPNLRLLCESL